MKYLFKEWAQIENLIKSKDFIFLLLDYDGTLTPITSRPEQAALSLKTKKLLKKLAAKTFFKLAIVSGRPLEEIRRLIGIKGIIYAGNHGLELKGPKIKFVNNKAVLSRNLLHRLYQDLRKELSSIKGAFVEDKGLTLSVHFRLASKKNFITKAKPILNKLLKPLLAKKKIRVTYGKMVYEVRPPVDWDKGRMVKWLMARHSAFRKKILPICIGDDRTDEDMFKAVGKKGITISVGRPKHSSKATYFLRNAEEVREFLNRLDNLKWAL